MEKRVILGILASLVAILVITLILNLNSLNMFNQQGKFCELSQNAASQYQYSQGCEPTKFSPLGMFLYSQNDSDQNVTPTIVNPQNLEVNAKIQIIDIN